MADEAEKMVNFARFMKYGEKFEEKAQVVLSEVFGTKLSESRERGSRAVVVIRCSGVE